VRFARERVDVCALPLLRPAREPVHRRADRRVAEVELGLGHFGARREHRRFRRVELALRAVEVRLRQRVLRSERFHPAEVRLGGREARLLRLQLAARRVKLGLERFGVELEEELAFLHDLAFLVGDLVEIARHSCDDVHLPRALGLRDEVRRQRDVLRLHRDDGHLGGGPLGRRRLLGAAGGEQRDGEARDGSCRGRNAAEHRGPSCLALAPPQAGPAISVEFAMRQRGTI
jgi:hypothetical protein